VLSDVRWARRHIRKPPGYNLRVCESIVSSPSRVRGGPRQPATFCILYTKTTTTVLQPFVQDYPGGPGGIEAYP